MAFKINQSLRHIQNVYIQSYFYSSNGKNLNSIKGNFLNISKRYARYQSTKCKSKKEVREDNLAAVLHGPKDLRMEILPVPEYGNNQVLLQMEVIGICGSDIQIYDNGKLGPLALTKPMILGHEASGTVIECGKNVKKLKIGDRVAVEPQISCRKCNFCKAGQYHLCPNIYFCAAPPNNGNLCRYYAHDADFCHKLPDQLDFEHAALLEPLALAVHACRRAQITSGDSVLILGTSLIGMVTILVAKAFGAANIVAMDTYDFRVKAALLAGANSAFNVTGCKNESILEMLQELLEDQPNKTLECSGCERSIALGIQATRKGGKLALVRMITENANIPISECIFRDLDILGIFRYVNDYPTAMNMVKTGQVDPKPLITHHFRLEESVKAFDIASSKKEPYMQILIHANPSWKPSC